VAIRSESGWTNRRFQAHNTSQRGCSRDNNCNLIDSIYKLGVNLLTICRPVLQIFRMRPDQLRDFTIVLEHCTID
jgi:hypothetical protein